MARYLLVGVALSIGMHGAMAAPSPDVPCHPGDPRAESKAFASFAGLPEPVRRLLLQHMAPDASQAEIQALAPRMMAERDQDFQVTDVLVGRDLPGRRFIQGMASGDRLYVWYESGGIAHLYHVAVFALDAKRQWALSSHAAGGSLERLCRALDGSKPVTYLDPTQNFW